MVDWHSNKSKPFQGNSAIFVAFVTINEESVTREGEAEKSLVFAQSRRERDMISPPKTFYFIHRLKITLKLFRIDGRQKKQ